MPVLLELPASKVITTPQQLDVACEEISKADVVSFDTETESLRYGSEIFTIGVCCEIDGNKELYCIDCKKVNPSPLILLLFNKNLICHNYKFDAKVIFSNFGVVLGKNTRVFDTQVMYYLLNEEGEYGLKELCDHLGIIKLRKLEEIAPTKADSAVPWLYVNMPDRLFAYNSMDAFGTYLLWEYLKDRLDGEEWPGVGGKTLLDQYLEVEEVFLKSVLEMELNGVYIDLHKFEEMRVPINRKMNEIRSFYSLKAQKPVNLDSTADLRSLFFDTLGLTPTKFTKGGKTGRKQASLDKEALEELTDLNPEIVEPLLEYRRLSKIYSTYIEGISKFLSSDGRVHGSFKIHGTVTGRLSSAEPNLQNIVSSQETSIGSIDIRSCFVAPKGFKMIAADFSQLEVRLTAHYTADKTLIKVIKEGLDLHSFTASRVFNIPYENFIEAKDAPKPTDGQKKLIKLRKAAKTLLFGILYGMGPQSLSNRLKIELSEAERMINQFYDTYPMVLQTKKDWISLVRDLGYIYTRFGRKRRLPYINSPNQELKSRAERQLFNFVIQGTASDLMRLYMPALVSDPSLKECGFKLIMQIHDEVVGEVRADCAEKGASRVKEVIENAVNQVNWLVPIVVDSHFGESWSDAKKA